MRITEVRYQRLHSFGDYENETVGGSAVLEEGDTADAALAQLRAWVDEHVGITQRDEQNRLESIRAHAELESINRHIREAERRWERIQAFFERLGLHPVFNDVPF